MATRVTPAGTTYTLPVQNDHPRIGLTNLSNYLGTRLSTIRGRITQSPWASYWSGFQARVQTQISKPNTDFVNLQEDGEPIAQYAFSWLLDPSKVSHAQKARDLVLYLSAQSLSSDEDEIRARGYGLAFIYDWLFNYGGFDSGDKQTVRNAVGKVIEAISPGPINDDGYIFGHGRGHELVALVLQAAIMEDGTANGRSIDYQRSRMDQMIDRHFKPRGIHEDEENMFALDRYAADQDGDRDGGSVRGSGGSAGYTLTSTNFFIWTWPTFLSLGINLYAQEKWFMDRLAFHLYHWRGDRTFFRIGELRNQTPYTSKYQKYALQVAAVPDADLVRTEDREHALWLDDEIRDVNNVSMEGNKSYYIHEILYRPGNISGVRPTVARFDGHQMRVFDKTGAVGFRTGWTNPGVRVVAYGRRHFISTHVKRDGGHWGLEVNGISLLDTLCHRDTRQQLAYKKFNDTLETGHTRSWGGQAVAHNGTVSIYHSGEKAGNIDDSFRFRKGVASQTYGYQASSGGSTPGPSNPELIIDSGTQLWPHATAGNLDHPSYVNLAYDFADIRAEPKWNYDGVLSSANSPKETSEYAYCVFGLTKHYWSSKCFKFRRHMVWIKSGVVTDWDFPILLIWDDLQVRTDPTYLNRTVRYNLLGYSAPVQVQANPQFTLRVSRSTARMFHKTLGVDMTYRNINGFKIENSAGNLIDFPGTNAGGGDDAGSGSGSGVWRTEIYPLSSPSGGTTWNLSLLHVEFPCTTSQNTTPPTNLVETSQKIGIRAGDFVALIQKGDDGFIVTTERRSKRRSIVSPGRPGRRLALLPAGK